MPSKQEVGVGWDGRKTDQEDRIMIATYHVPDTALNALQTFSHLITRRYITSTHLMEEEAEAQRSKLKYPKLHS